MKGIVSKSKVDKIKDIGEEELQLTILVENEFFEPVVGQRVEIHPIR